MGEMPSGLAPPPPEGLHEVTADWLTKAIGEAHGGAVTAVEATPIGTGQVADSARLQLEWDPPEAGPPTLVAKVTTASETSRAAARATRTYEVEVGFYATLAAELPVHAPRCHWAGYDEARCAYAVVLDDLAPAVQGDQMAGCAVDEAEQAIAELALLHAPRWGDPTLESLTWLNRSGPERPNELGALLAMVLPGFLERYASRLPDDVLALTERFVPRVPRYFSGDAGPATVVHNDFRNDNLLFGGPRVWVLDWQTVSLGPALSDLSYFLGTSVVIDDRRAHERELVRGYWERLTAEGVALSFDACWDDYRRYSFAGLIMALIASMLVERTDRGDEMFMAMAERSGRMVLDLDAEAFVDH